MKFQIGSVIAAALIVGVMGMGVGRSVHAQTPTGTDPEAVFRAAVDAFNRGDAAASASYFAEDVTATGLCPPVNVCHGRAELQAQLEREIAEGAQDEIRELTVNGDTASIKLTETVPGLADLGIERIYINISATVQNGRITSFTDELDLTDAQTAKFARAMAEQEQLPSTGTGYTHPSAVQPWELIALAALGLVLLATGTRMSWGSRKQPWRKSRTG